MKIILIVILTFISFKAKALDGKLLGKIEIKTGVSNYTEIAEYCIEGVKYLVINHSAIIVKRSRTDHTTYCE